MDYSVTPEQLIAVLREDWPKEFEITQLRLLNLKQQQHIRELENQLAQREEMSDADSSGS